MNRMKLHSTILISVWMIASCAHQGVQVEVRNTLPFQRQSELVSIQRVDLEPMVNCSEALRVIQKSTGESLMIQYLDLDADNVWENLLIQLTIDSLSSETMLLTNSSEPQILEQSKVYGRFVPERKDDFAWENDRIAFRMYGPALEASGEISSGVDVWIKNVEYPIIDKWYVEGDYHMDHGEGADFYKVGPTLGAGGLGFLINDTLYTSRNFTNHRILAQGPLRFVFELNYAIWGPDSLEIKETKRISLDAGQHFNRIESQLELRGDILKSGKFVAGLLAHPSLSEIPVSLNSTNDYMIMYEAQKGNNGFIGTALLRTTHGEQDAIKKYGNQYLMVMPVPDDGILSYHAGAGWSKSPWIDDESQWTDIVFKYKESQATPLKINILK